MQVQLTATGAVSVRPKVDDGVDLKLACVSPELRLAAVQPLQLEIRRAERAL